MVVGQLAASRRPANFELPRFLQKSKSKLGTQIQLQIQVCQVAPSSRATNAQYSTSTMGHCHYQYPHHYLSLVL